VMQDEIFGPILPIKTYTDLDSVIAHINARPHPLALYVFAQDSIVEKVLSRTRSGGAVVDDVILHVMQEDLPFGGIGQSGMGAYHAEAGFRTFSHARSVLHSTRFDPVHLLRPPYGERSRKLLNMLIKR
jgi:coniferyl-aldehyde dehydrogenase